MTTKTGRTIELIQDILEPNLAGVFRILIE